MDSLSYSGRLVNSNGSAVQGPANLTFDLSYTDQPNVTLCSQQLNGIHLSNGVFHVKLNFPSCNLTDILLNTPTSHSVTIRVTDRTLTPNKVYSQQPIYSVPYSFISQMSKQLARNGANDGQILAWSNAVNRWVPINPPPVTAGGIVNLVAGDGLYGGTITNSGVIGLQNGGVTAAKLHHMDAAPGEVLKWNGSSWEASDDVGVTTESDPHVRAFARKDASGVPPPVCDQHQALRYITLLDSFQCFDVVKNEINGTVTKLAPSQKAVADALDLKQDLINDSFKLTHTDSSWVGIQTPAGADNFFFTLPGSKGVNGQILKTDGTGNLFWGNSEITSTDISDGTIVDSDIATNAGIQQSKIAGLTAALASKQDASSVVSVTQGGTGLSSPGVAGNLLRSNGSLWESWVPNYLTVETDPTVNNLGKAVLACSPDEIPKFNGVSWSCASDEGLTSEADTLQSVTDRGNSTNNFITFSNGAEFSKIGIGTSNPVGVLDIQSTSSGILIPRMTTAQRTAISSPATGMQIYNIETNELNFYNGTEWKALGVSGSGISSITAGTGLLGGTISSSGTISVNTGTGANQIVQLNGSSQLPAVSGALLTNINPSALSSVVPVSKGGTGLSSSGTSGNLLRSDGTNWVSWSPNFLSVETDPTVNSLGKSLLACIANEIPKFNGVSWICASDEGLTSEADTLQAVTDRGTSTNKFLTFSGGAEFSKIGIGTSNPVGVLDIQSTTSGILIPRMTTAQRTAISSPATGMQIYNIETNELNFYNGTEWKALGVAGSGVTSITAGTGLLGGTINSSGTVSVNAGTGANQIVQLNGSSQLPAVSGALLTNINPSSLSAPVPLNKGGTGLASGGAGNSILGMNALGTGAEYKTIAGNSPLVINHGVGSVSFELSTVPVSKGGTGLTSFVSDRLYVSNLTGQLVPFFCTPGYVLAFDITGKPDCLDTAGYFSQGGNNFGTSAVLGTNTNQPLSFETNDSIHMTILSNGNVGIGTINPTQKLTVVGMIETTSGGLKLPDGTVIDGAEDLGSSTSTSALVKGWPDAIVCNYVNWGPTIFYLEIIPFSGDNNVYYKGRARDSVWITANYTTKVFAQYGSAVTDCAGKSLSTLISEGKTRYFGNDIAAVNSDHDNDTKIMVEKNTDEDMIRFDTAGSERMIIDSIGNVGIGLTSPGAKLNVKGAIRLSGDTSGYTGFAPAANAGSTVWTLPTTDGTSGQILRTDGSGNLSWVNNDTLATGTVAQFLRGDKTWQTLNTAAVPESGANVYFSDARARGAVLTGYVAGLPMPVASTDTIMQALMKLEAQNNKTKDDYVPKSGATMTGALNLPNNGLKVGTNDIVVSGSNVGVGTASPQAKLHVEGTVKIVDGSEHAGHTLTSDASGNATWQKPKTWGQVCSAGQYLMGFDNNGNKVCGSTLVNFAGAAQSGGGSHHCAIMSDSTVACWGYNAAGQLGNNTTANQPIGTFVRKADGSKLASVTSLALSWMNSCAVSAGEVYCWGDNAYYQGGIGTTADTWLATKVSGINTAVDVASGTYHTCARLSDGRVMCWGLNDNGQIGNNTLVTQKTPSFVLSETGVGHLTGVTELTAGSKHNCVTKSGGVYCWGDNAYGMLGDGTLADKKIPVATNGMTTGVSTISASLAYYNDGTTTTWRSTTCAIKTDGTVWCWGRCSERQCGYLAAPAANLSSPVQVQLDQNKDNVAEGPLTGAVSLAMGSLVSCAVMSDTTVKCWGSSASGVVAGDGTTTQRPFAVPVSGIGNVGELSNVKGMSITGQYNNGAGVTAIAILNDGNAVGWGSNVRGQVGDNSVTNRLTPVGLVQP